MRWTWINEPHGFRSAASAPSGARINQSTASHSNSEKDVGVRVPTLISHMRGAGAVGTRAGVCQAVRAGRSTCCAGIWESSVRIMRASGFFFFLIEVRFERIGSYWR